MYQVDELIVYGNTGVCRVEAVELPSDIPSADKTRLYYRLKPLSEPGVIRTPVDTPVFMRPVISRAQAEQLLCSIPAVQPAPCASRSPQMLVEHYKAFFLSHSCEDLLCLIKTLYEKARAGTGRVSGKTDQHYLKRAEDLLYSELAVALGISGEEAKALVADALSAGPSVPAS